MSHNNYFATIKRRIHPIYKQSCRSSNFLLTDRESSDIFLPTHPPSAQTQPNTPKRILLKAWELLRTRSKIHLNYHLTEVDPSIIHQNTQVNSDNSGTSEKSFRIAQTPPPLLDALTLNKSSCEICILHQISRKNLNFAFPSL